MSALAPNRPRLIPDRLVLLNSCSRLTETFAASYVTHQTDHWQDSECSKMAAGKRDSVPAGRKRRARVVLRPAGKQAPSRSRPYHHGAVREKLIAEAFILAEEGGLAAVSLREAARRLGVSHTAAYHHFSGKADIVAAAAAIGMWRLAANLERAGNQTNSDALERICRLAAAYVEFALQNAAVFRLMFAPEVARKAGFPELRRASDAAAAPLVRALQDWRKRKNREHVDDEVRELAIAVWAMVHGLAVLAMDAQFDEGKLSVPAGDHAASYGAIARRAIGQLLG
jgi:AcrR family transcriptional regulator